MDSLSKNTAVNSSTAQNMYARLLLSFSSSKHRIRALSIYDSRKTIAQCIFLSLRRFSSALGKRSLSLRLLRGSKFSHSPIKSISFTFFSSFLGVSRFYRSFVFTVSNFSFAASNHHFVASKIIRNYIMLSNNTKLCNT